MPLAIYAFRVRCASKNNYKKNMDKLIACCGLNCAECDARIATMNNDDKLREATAKKWRVEYNAPGITTEMINCTGCRMEGVKVGHCSECDIRNCTLEMGYAACADCSDIDTCPKIEGLHKFVPQAKENLMLSR